MKITRFIALVAFPGDAALRATEAIGRAGLRTLEGMEVETEFYTGRRGYLHGGIGLLAPLNERQKIGATLHLVREESGASVFPSLGAEFIHDFGAGRELEAFSFCYFPVEQERAWAVGWRASQRFTWDDHVSLSPFFGAVYARVRAIDESTEEPAGIGHSMLMAGVTMETKKIEWTVFGSHSFFSRDPSGLETHVDLEEMTHFAAYENNDGFARHSAGTELTWSPANRLTLTSRYAFIHFDDATRHSFSFAPSLKLNGSLEVFAGFQLLRGSARHNDLFTACLAVSF